MGGGGREAGEEQTETKKKTKTKTKNHFNKPKGYFTQEQNGTKREHSENSQMLKIWKAEIEITEVGLKGKVEKSVHEVVQKKENRRG